MSISLFPLKAANTTFMTVCNISSLSLPRMQDGKSLTLSWRSFPRWGRECVYICFDYEGGQYIKKRLWRTKVNILRFPVGYLNATINRDTWNTEQEIGTDRSRQTQPNLWGDGYKLGFGLIRGRGSGSWTGFGPIQPSFALKPTPLAGFPDPLLTLHKFCESTKAQW